MSESTIITRPIWNDEMKNELAKIVGKIINDWGNDKPSLEFCVEKAKVILNFNCNTNGYELAKLFDNEGFDPDSELVELLDEVSYIKHEIKSDFIEKWVVENALTLDFIEGQKVIAKIFREGEIECEIVKLYPETMQYGLWYQSIGYEKGKGHSIVNYENIVHSLA